jgi:hypothetical protein
MSKTHMFLCFYVFGNAPISLLDSFEVRLKPKQIEPFAKQHLFNNSSVQQETETKYCAPWAWAPALALHRIVCTALPRQ